MQIDVTPIRIFYAKTSRAKYISHLDTMRTITRALRRSRLPLWYTQGFNPHLYITFALPISLGYEGLCESFDIRLTKEIEPDKLVKAMSAVMPMGFEIIRAAMPEMEPPEIACADYDVRLIYSADDREKAGGMFDAFLGLPEIPVIKKTKKGEATIDIKPFVQVLSSQWDDSGCALKLRTAAGITLNINPTLFLKAFYSWSNTEPQGVRITRTAILDKKCDIFR